MLQFVDFADWSVLSRTVRQTGACAQSRSRVWQLARKPENLKRKAVLALLLQLLSDGKPATHEITDSLWPAGSGK